MDNNLDINNHMCDFNWVKWVPVKVYCFVWSMLCNRILMACKLVKKEDRLDFVTCHLCGEKDECVENIFLQLYGLGLVIRVTYFLLFPIIVMSSKWF